MKGLLTILYALLFFAVAPNSLATSLTFEVQPGIYLSDATILGLNLNYSGSWIEYSYANIPFTAYSIGDRDSGRNFLMFFKEVNGQRRYMTGNSINSQLRARRGEDPTTITELSTLVNDPRTFVMLEARSGVYLKNTRTGGYIALDYSEPGSVPYPAILVGREEQASAIHSSL